MRDSKQEPNSQPQNALAEATDDILTGYMDQLLQRALVTDDVSSGTLVVDGEVQGWEPDLQTETESEQQDQPQNDAVDDTERVASAAETFVEAQTAPHTANQTATDAIAEGNTLSESAAQTLAASQVKDAPSSVWEYQTGNEFECLLMRAGEYRLAIPMGSLGTLHTIDRKPSQVPGQAPFVLGTWHHKGRTFQVLDCLKLIMPERVQPEDATAPAFLLQLGDSGWLLACDELFDPVTLTGDDVRWRQSNADRAWMAGILKEEMCVLLEVRGLLGLLGSEPGVETSTTDTE